MFRIWFAVGFCLLIVLTACESAQSTNELAAVRIGVELGSLENAGSYAPLGVPIDPDSGLVGVTEAQLTVFQGATQLYFDAGGELVESEIDGAPIILTSAQSSRVLKLPHGTYDFLVEARDSEGPPANVLANGELRGELVNADVALTVPLTSIIAAATLSGPVSVLPNQLFDVYLDVHPPGRSDLNLPTSDYDADYETTGGTVQGTSDIGIRVSAQCEEVVIDANVYAPDDAETSQANDSLTIPVDFTCPAVDGNIGVDLVPPFIDIGSVGGPYTTATSITLNGYVRDAETGIESVMLYEGTVEMWEANLLPPATEGDYTIWSLETYPDVARDYTFTAIATDKAGNETRVSITLTVSDPPLP